MKTLAQQIELIVNRMNELAAKEQSLVASLGDSLNQADQRLLDEIRTVTIEHETRRSLILGELQVLADRVGLLPRPIDLPLTALEDSGLATHAAIEEAMREEGGLRGGDWREAVTKISEEFVDRPRKRAATH